MKIRKIVTFLMCVILLVVIVPKQVARAATTPISRCKITIAKKQYMYSGKKIKPQTKVVYRGKKLKKNKDYSVKYIGNKLPGKATVLIMGKGNYKGVAQKTFKIKNGLNVKLSTKQVLYSGKKQMPGVTVKCGSKKLSAKQFTVSYRNNINVGMAYIIVKGKGKYKKKKAYVEFEILDRKEPSSTDLQKNTSENPTNEVTTVTTEKTTEAPSEATEGVTEGTSEATEEVTEGTSEATTEEITAELIVQKQFLDYTESVKKIQNPDQGFYYPLYLTLKTTGMSYNASKIKNDYQLYHIRLDISEFSEAINGDKDMELTPEALAQFAELLELMQVNGKNAIVRLAYDPGFDGAKDNEPETEMMVKHIKQISQVLNRYPDVITAIEVGMIGPWGEMHSSKIAKDWDVNRALIDAYLDSTVNYPILVRTPERIYRYLNIELSQINDYTISKEDKAYRLGLFNDGYLGTPTDYGTFTKREIEIPWIAKQTAHMPYGGEVTVPDSELHNIEICTPEMFQVHLSYLNIQWNDSVIAKWKSTEYTDKCGDDDCYYGQTAFAYIENHMGYRYVLREATFIHPTTMDSLKVQAMLENVGFGNLNRRKKATILLQDEEGMITEILVEDWNGEENIAYDLNLKEYHLKSGEYKVYLRMDNGDSNYAIEFANDLWNESLQANQIGMFVQP